MIKGIDVSNNNGVINWPDVAKPGYAFEFAKATEGTTYYDPTFERNTKQAKAAGLVTGAYGFARPATSKGVDEARALLAAIQSVGGVDMPPMLDMEDAGGLNNADLVAWCREWGETVYNATGKLPILYASSSFIREHGLKSLAVLFDLFVADYTTASSPDLGGWPHPWKFWQHADNGNISGHTGAFDLDVFNGTLDDLKSYVKGVKKVSDPILYEGDKNTESVKKLQTLLNAHGANPQLTVDGIYGPVTLQTVLAFKRANHLPKNGVIGAPAWKALEAPELAAATPSAPTPTSTTTSVSAAQTPPTPPPGYVFAGWGTQTDPNDLTKTIQVPEWTPAPDNGKFPTWTSANTRPVYDLHLTSTKNSDGTLDLQAQITYGGLPWKTPGIPVDFNINGVSKTVDTEQNFDQHLSSSQPLTDDNGIAALPKIDPSFYGNAFLWVNAMAMGNFTGGQLVTDKLRVDL